MKIKELLKPAVIGEFIRYAIVGGISFLADFGTLTLFEELIFRRRTDRQIFISAAAGFTVGLVINYILSMIFVFRAKDNKNNGRTAGDFIIFALVGVIGLAMTEGLMHLGANVLGFHYMITKVVTAGLVLVWNYLGRKTLVFGRTRREKK